MSAPASGIAKVVTAEELAAAMQPRTWLYTEDREKAVLIERAEKYLAAVDSLLTADGFFVVKWEERALGNPMRPCDRVGGQS